MPVKGSKLVDNRSFGKQNESPASRARGIGRRLVQYLGPRHSRTPPTSRNMFARIRSSWVMCQESIFLV